MTAIYVASPVEVYRGADAEQRLRENNDAGYWTPRGILSVPRERWEQAQAYERATWLDYNPQAFDDRNGEHRDGFGGYAVVPASVGDYLELGCGPFTNGRLILEGRTAASTTLVDPLITDYLDHPHCSYAFGRWPTPVELVHSTAEDYVPVHGFDTVAVINVLAHCYDADKVLDTIRRALRPGGILIWHEPPREHNPNQHYDVGHPIAPHTAWLEDWLSEFSELYRNGSYFIGKRKALTEWTEPVAEVSANAEELPFAVLYEDEPEPEEKPDPEPPKPKRTRKPRTKSS